ncbi:MAG: glycoside hydrolase family 2 TIM barrel-domain containing protein [Solirubrobacteraceae bacterium]
MSIRSASGPDPAFTRRALLRAGALGSAALAVGAPAARALTNRRRKPLPQSLPPITETYDFNQGWRFGGVYQAGAENPSYPDAGFRRVNLPHTVVPLSWGDWEPSSWEQLWIYRKRFSIQPFTDGRVFLDFDGVMTDSTVYLNGVELAQHVGGFLPFSVELTELLIPGENDLGVVVDGRLLNVPPLGNSNGASAVDYLTPAGVYRDVRLRIVPEAYISDVFAKPVNVLTPRPGLTLTVNVESPATVRDRMRMTVDLLDGTRKLKTRTFRHKIIRGTNVISVNLSDLRVSLWSPSAPKLYTVRVTLSGNAVPSHTVEVRTGFRQVKFKLDGFYLNGQRLQIVGLARHQLFPYTGMAASGRLQARDAQLLKDELNCNMVRCSHYPPSPRFLDACDELGLMVWEEPPGWDYIGDENFKAIFLQNVGDMVLRDRNRPSVVVWAPRLNETQSYPTLYAEARQLVAELDGTRPTSGAMMTRSTTGWAEDVFAYNDYGSTDYGSPSANVALAPPVPGVPYLVSEAVGAITGAPLYRWIDASSTLQSQAKLHAQVNQQARANPAYSGALSWASVDYASLVGAKRVWHNLRWPGVIDTFRVPKPGAAVYRSQVSPLLAPMIVPAFFWDFGPNSPPTGPGPNSILATNCDRLEVYVDGQLLTVATPDRTDFGNLPFPPVLVDLTVDGSTSPTLTVTGFYQDRQVAMLQMSANPATDRLGLELEDRRIIGDGSDTTRLTFRAVDALGNQRPYVSGDVTLSLRGPAAIVGQNPFAFGEYGGVGGVIIRSEARRTGTVHITARHPTLGAAQATLTVAKATGRYL